MTIVRQMAMLLLVVVLAACGAQPIDDTAGHGAGAEHGDTQASTAPYDAQFIDGMTLHHQAAVAMAEQALTESERPEIQRLAQLIITTQKGEIELMATWRQQWYPNLATTGGTGEQMGEMELSSDSSLPFDQRFITAMISHHNGAIDMAKEAQTRAEHAEIKQLAGQIVQAQEAEVLQLKGWQHAWFPE